MGYVLNLLADLRRLFLGRYRFTAMMALRRPYVANIICLFAKTMEILGAELIT